MARRKPSLSVKQSERFFTMIETQPAQLNLEQFKEISERLTHDAEWTRLCLITLTRTGAQLYEVTDGHDGAVQFARLLLAAKDVRKRLKSLSGLIETAEARLLIALAHRDEPAETILKEAQGEETPAADATVLQ